MLTVLFFINSKNKLWSAVTDDFITRWPHFSIIYHVNCHFSILFFINIILKKKYIKYICLLTLIIIFFLINLTEIYFITVMLLQYYYFVCFRLKSACAPNLMAYKTLVNTQVAVQKLGV